MWYVETPKDTLSFFCPPHILHHEEDLGGGGITVSQCNLGWILNNHMKYGKYDP